jgi:flagellar FliL protein
MVELENIIVNPAGSQGNRFLMTSVAFAVADEQGQKRLDESKVELRDKVTGVLESMTMAQLTAPGARDTLKARIAAMAGGMLGPKATVKVFLPQFVIQ